MPAPAGAWKLSSLNSLHLTRIRESIYWPAVCRATKWERLLLDLWWHPSLRRYADGTYFVTVTYREIARSCVPKTVGNRLKHLEALGAVSRCGGRASWRTAAGGYASTKTKLQLFLPAEWADAAAQQTPPEVVAEAAPQCVNSTRQILKEESLDSLPSESVPAKEGASRWVTDPPPKPPPPPPPRTGPTSLEAALARLGASISGRSASPSIPPGNECRLE